jgi:flagellar hook-associated protein 1
MTSTFFGINTAMRALDAQRKAMDTTAHNVANANTDGFTRQTAEMRASTPFPVPSMSREVSAGQMGTGVDVAAILRVRDSFIDTQVREQTSSLGTADTTKTYLEQIESLVNEPSTSGINSLLNKMYAAWYDLSNSADSYVAKAAVVQTSSVLADAVRRVANQLSAMNTSAGGEVSADLADVNSSLKEIADLNGQIVMVKAAGDQPNDLMDRRDLLLDKISEYAKISYQETENGAVTVSMAGTTVVQGKTYEKLAYGDEVNGYLDTLRSLNTAVAGGGPPDVAQRTSILNSISSRVDAHSRIEADGRATVWFGSDPADPAAPGSTILADGLGTLGAETDLGSIVTASSGADATAAEGDLRALLDLRAGDLNSQDGVGKGIAWRLEQMAISLRDQVNVAANGQPVFVSSVTAGTVAQTLVVNNTPPNDYVSDPAKLLAGAAGVPGDGSYALAVSHLQDTGGAPIDGEDISVNAWYQKMIAQLGIDSKQAQAEASNQKLLVDHVKTNREAQSGVSLDEEAANLIRFERAYQAAARVMTVMDDMLDKIINSMGRVGL